MEAEGATKAVSGETVGKTPSTATKREEGTRRSVCRVISRERPVRSRDWPRERRVLEAAVTRREERDMVDDDVCCGWGDGRWDVGFHPMGGRMLGNLLD